MSFTFLYTGCFIKQLSQLARAKGVRFDFKILTFYPADQFESITVFLV